MKETNMEHYRGDIEEIYKHNGGFALINGKIVPCGDEDCRKCSFNYGSCNKETVQWLMSEYKPEPVLTAREKHFVEFVQEGWLAKDQVGHIFWHKVKPFKKERNGGWSNAILAYNSLPNADNNMFPFIAWEDEEPWAVEELRKLKVGDQDA